MQNNYDGLSESPSALTILIFLFLLNNLYPHKISFFFKPINGCVYSGVSDVS